MLKQWYWLFVLILATVLVIASVKLAPASLDTTKSGWVINNICKQPQQWRRGIWLYMAGPIVQHQYAMLSTAKQEQWWSFASHYYGCSF